MNLIKKMQRRLNVEELESRWLPATWSGVSVGDILFVEQIGAAVGNLDITEDGAVLSLTDTGVGTATFSTAGVDDIWINFLGTEGPGTDVTYSKTGNQPGNLNLILRNVDQRDLTLDGGGTIQGNVNVFGGAGENDTTVGDLTIFGNVTLNLGNGGGVNSTVFSGGTAGLFVFGDVTVRGGDSREDVVVGNDASLVNIVGDLSIVSAGAGNDSVQIGEAAGDVSIFGNVGITTGAGDDVIEIRESGGSAVRIFGNLAINSSFGNDSVDIGAAGIVQIQGSVTGYNVDTMVYGAGGDDFIGRNLHISNSSSSFDNTIVVDSLVAGRFTYLGGSGAEDIDISGSIGQYASIDLGSQGASDTSTVDFNGSTSIGSNLLLRGGSLGVEQVNFDTGGMTSVGGTLTFVMGGGTNEVRVETAVGGPNVFYSGGSDSDTFVFNRLAGSALSIRVTAFTFDGDDSVALDGGPAPVGIPPLVAYVNLGPGSDTYTQTGTFPAFVVDP